MTTPAADASEDDPWFEGPAWSNKEGKDDDTFAELLPGKGDVEFFRLDKDALWEDYNLKGDAIALTVDGSLAHGQWHREIDTAEDDNELEWYTVTIKNKAPMVATVGSAVFHGGVLAGGTGSPNVKAMGKPVWRMLVDQHVCPALTPNPHSPGFVVPTSKPTVLVNGFPIARAGDSVLELVGGPNPIIMGADSVLAGSPAPPVTTINPVPRKKEDSTFDQIRKWFFNVDVKVEVDASIDIAPQVDTATLGGELDPFDGVWGGAVKVTSEGELVHGKGRIAAEATGTFFGMDWDWGDSWEDEGGAGKWKAEGEVFYDPVLQRPGARGEIEFGESEDD